MRQPIDVVSEIMENYLYRNRYFRTDWNGEPVYLSTDSAEGGHRYLKWSYVNGVVHIEAWMKGTFGGEDDLDGGGKKKAYKDSLEQLIMQLQNPPGDEYSGTFSGSVKQTAYTPPRNSYNTQQTAYTPSQNSQHPTYTGQWMTGVKQVPAQNGYNPAGNTYVSGENVTGSIPGNPNGRIEGNPDEVSSAYNLALIAAVLAFVFPLIGLILGIVGKQRCQAAMQNDTTGKAKKGKTMCTVAMIIPIVSMVLSMVFSMLVGFVSVYNMY